MRRQAIAGAIVLTGIVGGAAWAQEPADVFFRHQVQAGPVPPDPVVGFKFGMMAVEPFEMAEAVEDAPYSAEIVNETKQQLPDGNRIERHTTGLVARDSRGRVRREQQLAAIGPVVPSGEARMVTISDPVAGVHYSLDPDRKVALRSPLPGPGRAHVKGAVGAVGLMTATRVAGPEGPGAPAVAGTFELRVEGPGKPGAPDVRNEPLGTKEFEGIRAEGTRTVATVPAGAIGNLRPIEIVSERWYSPELRVVVFSRRDDPRFGETTYRLTNLTRAEPDTSLFQVPPDYGQEDLKPPPLEPRP